MPAPITTTTLLTTAQATELLGLAPGTLATWRWRKTVRLPFIRVGGSVRYRLADIEAFLAKNVVDGAGKGVAQ